MRKLFAAGPLIATCVLTLVWQQIANATTYRLPPEGESMIGELQYVQAKREDTLLALGRRYSIGYEEMIAANPGVDPWLPGEGTVILIPSRYLLPDAPREGIVVNVPEHRLYYFPPAKPGEEPSVQTYPVSTGKMDWKTPVAVTKIVDKRINPVWYPPESVRNEHAARGDYLPKMVPAGPDNPLGEFAMKLGIPGGSYLIHGTNKPAAVGMEVTHGCIRMFPEDIEQFFKRVPLQTPVRIVTQPTKMGWIGERLFIESHPPSAEVAKQNEMDLTDLTRAFVAATQSRAAPLDWRQAEKIFREHSGIPTELRLQPGAVNAGL